MSGLYLSFVYRQICFISQFPDEEKRQSGEYMFSSLLARTFDCAWLHIQNRLSYEITLEREGIDLWGNSRLQRLIDFRLPFCVKWWCTRCLRQYVLRASKIYLKYILRKIKIIKYSSVFHNCCVKSTVRLSQMCPHKMCFSLNKISDLSMLHFFKMWFIQHSTCL